MSDTLFVKMLSQKALPWAGQWDVLRFIVARAARREVVKQRLPDGVATSSNKPGPSIAVRGPRFNSQSGLRLRRWPQAGLESKRVPLLTCTIQGQADLRFGDYILHCPEGQFILQPPRVPAYDGSHPHLEGERRELARCQMLTFSPWNEYTVHCWMCESQGENHRTLANYYINNRQALLHLKAINDEGEAQRSGYETVCRGLLVAFISIVHRELTEGNYVQWIAPESRSSDRIKVGDPLIGAQQYIKANLSEPLTIERVAHEVFLSRSLFARRFRAECGKTFTEYLTECRLAQAKILLSETDWPIASVGRAVGLKSSRLLEIFHLHMGTSPGRFRENIWQQRKVDDSGID
jgi:AraC-like DNA-binding protein